jgi:hypothetical protein
MRIPTKKIALTNSQIVQLVEGLNVISKGRQVTVDGKNVERGYALTADLRYALARIGILVKPLVEAFKTANDQIFRDHDPVSEPDKDGKDQLTIPTDRLLSYQDATAELFAQATEPIAFPLVSYEAMKVGDDKGQNPIPPNAIAALDPVLVWTQAEYDALAKQQSEPKATAAEGEGD